MSQSPRLLSSRGGGGIRKLPEFYFGKNILDVVDNYKYFYIYIYILNSMENSQLLRNNCTSGRKWSYVFFTV